MQKSPKRDGLGFQMAKKEEKRTFSLLFYGAGGIFALCPRTGYALSHGTKQENSVRVLFFGAGGRARTDTGFIPRDFKSLASANSTTPAWRRRQVSAANFIYSGAHKRTKFFYGKGGATKRTFPLAGKPQSKVCSDATSTKGT